MSEGPAFSIPAIKIIANDTTNEMAELPAAILYKVFNFRQVRELR